MSLAPDHKALVFLCSVAVLGAGVRVVRANKSAAPPTQPALEHQLHVADSASTALHARASLAKRRGHARGDTSARAPVDSPPPPKRRTRRSVSDSAASPHQSQGALDRPGYLNGKLDLDVASAAQIDSLPGVSPTMAKRIAIDRVKRGPFTTMDGLRRVEGVGNNFIHLIDTLVTFSGTVKWPSSSDTIIVHRTNTRAPRPP